MELTNTNNQDLLYLLNKIKNKEVKEGIGHLSNKLWKCFLGNDGSMTKMLRNIYENSLKMVLISSEVRTKDNVIEMIEDILGIQFLNKTDSYVERVITFNKDDKVIMNGISFWVHEDYKRIYDDESKPIGLVMEDKEIELFKKIRNFIYEDKDRTVIIRLSVYKIGGRYSFVLFELFNPLDLESVINKFE